MKRVLLLAALLCSLSWTAGAQDWRAGAEAHERGDYDTARQVLLPLARAGDRNAQYTISVMYAKGHGFYQDNASAVVWLHRAAENGLPLAQYDLGVRYEKGRGVMQDDAEAVKWWLRAAEDPLADAARYNLGVMYADGRGVKQDYAKALE